MTLRESERDQRAVHIAPLAGRLTLLEPGAGIAAIAHAVRAGTAWIVNRGTRELWDRWIGASKGGGLTAANFAASAGRAGEMRLFDYALEVGAPIKHTDAALANRLPPGLRLAGSKRLTYGLRSNPWRQLTELRLESFPDSAGVATLKLDGRFLARQGVPLLRITKQENHVVALAEFASLAMCWMRTMVSVHSWSFRAPDPAHPRKPQLLPVEIQGLPQPQHHLIEVEARPPAAPVQVLLTNYPNPGRRPLALVHGYSASGSTFTHRAIPQPLARYLWQRGHDVWVLDLRTSAAMQTATLPWRFEDAAFVDLPAAIAFVRERTGQTVDVFAHCIGAVMLSMALLGDADMVSRWYGADLAQGWNRSPRWDAERNGLAANLGRIVLSQKGPVLVYSDDNVLRAYFMRMLRRVVLPDDYQFHIPAEQNAADALMDRLFCTLPYPEAEFVRENPLLPPWRRALWAGFRHRMDALYARDFSLEHVSTTTLAAIADLFGPLHLDTVAQAIHFARLNTITDRAGEPFDTSGARLRARWPRGGTLAIHGAENGLVDVHTVHLLKQQMDFAGVPFRECVHPGLWPPGLPDRPARGARRVSPHRRLPAMSTGMLWKLPSVALKRVPAGWHVKSERGWGQALALFAPLRRVGQDWELALPESGAIELTPVDDRAWRPVPLPALHATSHTTSHTIPHAASHYLCLLRYDQPLQRPERSVARDRFLPPRHVPGHTRADGTPGMRVPARELRTVLAQVRADAGERFANYVMTAPVPPARREGQPDALSFAFASCQYPAGMLDRTIAHTSWRALAAHVAADAQHGPERILLVGDQVYVDATYGLLDPLRPDDSFRLAYEDFADRETGPFAPLPQDLMDRMRLMPDDHEIIDNWEPCDGRDDRFELAMDAFWQYQRLGDRRRVAVQLRDRGPGWRLYMADSRTQRDERYSNTVERATLLGERQTRQLERWLRCMPREQLKIVTTAAMLLPRVRENMDDPLYLDNWQGYPTSLRRMLAFLCEQELRNVVFLSGDAHIGCSADITVTSDGPQRALPVAPCAGAVRPLSFRQRVALEPAAAGRLHLHACELRLPLHGAGGAPCRRP